MAAQENHDGVVKYLLAHGANQSLATEVRYLIGSRRRKALCNGEFMCKILRDLNTIIRMASLHWQ